MKKLTSSTVVLALAFSVLLMAYIGIHVVQYESGQRERSHVEQQPGVLKQRKEMSVRMRAINAAGQRQRDEIIEKDHELTKAGIYGEQRRKEMLKTLAASRRELDRTLDELRVRQ